MLYLLQNIFFLMHLPFRDAIHVHHVGPSHSPASRWGPLFGHLLLLINRFKDGRLSATWDNLDPPARYRWTQATLHAVSSLIEIFRTWAEPKFAPDHTFFEARFDDHPPFILLSPLVDHGQSIDKALQSWRKNLTPFDQIHLHQHSPLDGFFALDTPDWFRPALAVPKSLPSHHQSTFHTANPTSQPSMTRSNLTPAAASQSSAPKPPPGTPRSGELTKASCPLVQWSGTGPPKPFGDILRELQQGGAKLLVPSFQSDGKGRDKRFCFRYITYPEAGCVTRTCRYYHYDANSSTQYKIPQSYFHDILQFIRRPELAQYFQPTEHLTKLATQR